MSQNLTPRPYKFTIGPEDWSDGLVAFDGADTKINYTDGLVSFRGKATIGRPLGFATLDDRKNSLFNRGTPVIVEFRDDSSALRRSPRGGYLFILSSSYDFNARLNTIELGDALALLSVAEGKGDRTGICLGVGESRRSIINRLLKAAGAPLLIDEIPGILSVPLPKLLEGSYIQQAGQIAASAGYFLYVDSLNQVRAKVLNPDEIASPIAIDLSSGATEIKRLTGESPAQYVFAKMQVTIAQNVANGTVFESETFGPAAIAGISSSEKILTRRERRVEHLVENRREVSTLVYEPVGAVIKNLAGDAGLIISTETQETYYYETDAQVKANPLAAKCETGNQARLLKRELRSWRPYGAVLPRVVASLPSNASVSQVSLILDTYEIETFNYDRPSDVIIPDRPVYDRYEDIAPQASKLYGLTHNLERSEARGKVSPEDYLYEKNNTAFINADVLGPAPSYYVHKKWVEQRLNEWVATEENGDAFARAYSEDANALRQKFKSGNFIYSRDTFTAAILVSKTTTVSSNGNTQPPSPDTMPPKVSVDTATITGKASFPIDSSYQFRPRPLDITFDYVDIPGNNKAAVDSIRAKANQLAAIWGKVVWGRFKGISCSTEFSQQWWDYSPLDRINIIETTPGLNYSEADTSAYLGDGFAIAITKQECFIGFDGIYLGFLKLNQINPPYKQVFINDLQLGFQVSYKTTSIETPLEPILSSYLIQLGLQTQYLAALAAPTSVVATGSSTTPYNLAISWTATVLTSGQTIAFYEIEYKNNGTTNIYQSTKQSSTTTTIFTGLAVGIFQARVRTVDAAGRRSPWSESNNAEISQVPAITSVTAQSSNTAPVAGTTVTLTAIVTGLGAFSSDVIWTVQPASTVTGTITTVGSNVTYAIPSNAAVGTSRLRATSVQDSTKFSEILLSVQAKPFVIVSMDIVVELPIVPRWLSSTIPMDIAIELPLLTLNPSIAIPMDIVVDLKTTTTTIVPISMDVVIELPITTGAQNLLVNGPMAITQPPTATTITANTAIPIGTSGYQFIDNWYAYSADGNPSVLQVSGSGSTATRVQMSGAAGTTAIGIGQRIGASKSAQLGGRLATLSVELSNSLLSSVAWSAFYPSSTEPTIVATASVGSNPLGAAYCPTNDRIYIANYSSSVSVINPSTNAVVGTISLGSNAVGAIYCPSNDRVYVALYDGYSVVVINPSTNAVVATISVGSGPQYLSYSPSNDRIYVALSNTNSVSIINPSTNAVIETISVGSGPIACTYSQSSNQLYVSNLGGNSVSIINLGTNTVATTISASGPFRSCSCDSTDRIYIADSGSNTVSVFNPATNAVVTTIAVGTSPTGCFYLPSTDRIYVTNRGSSNNISVINPTTNTVVATIPTGISPYDIAYDSLSKKLYVTNFGANTVTVIDPAVADFGTIAAPTKTQIAAGTFTANSSINSFTSTFACDANVQKGIEVLFTVGAQTSGTWVIGNARLEVAP